jgi:23S rRNA (pseudouridine1915-N3)-methyltransferase
MKISLCSIANRPRADEFQALTALYLERTSPYADLDLEFFRNVEQFFSYIDKLRGRTSPLIVLLDSRGKQLSSEDFSDWIRTHRDQGLQQLVFAIGPPDGWTVEARKRAAFLLSLGSMTLPHELARVVLAEQIYRAFTILAGHPYHTGHSL